MSKQSIKIWGRLFSLPIDYDVLDNEIVSEEQRDALKAFLQLSKIDGSEEVIKYCLKMNPDDVHKPVTNIFKYVIPRKIFVCRKPKTVSLLCDYKFDPDNGIAVVYENGKIKKVGTQDLVL